MNYIIGEFTYNLDQKGRLVIPTKFREFLGELFVITKGLDGCLFVFPEREWQNFEAKWAALPLMDKTARSFARFFFASAAECSLDKQGRVMIPPSLRHFAGLEKTVVITGMSGRLEIWDESAWRENTDIDPEVFGSHMAELGI